MLSIYGELEILANFGRVLADRSLKSYQSEVAFAPNSRSSQSFASFQSRKTVYGETCREWAISSVERPPKNFISTTWHLRASFSANAFRASSRASNATSCSAPRLPHSSRDRRRVLPPRLRRSRDRAKSTSTRRITCAEMAKKWIRFFQCRVRKL